MKLLPVSGGSNRFTKNEGFSKYIFSSKAKMTGFKVVEKSKSCCGSKQIRILQPLRFGEKYRLSSKTPRRKVLEPQRFLDFSFFIFLFLSLHELALFCSYLHLIDVRSDVKIFPSPGYKLSQQNWTTSKIPHYVVVILHNGGLSISRRKHAHRRKLF